MPCITSHKSLWIDFSQENFILQGSVIPHYLSPELITVLNVNNGYQDMDLFP